MLFSPFQLPCLAAKREAIPENGKSKEKNLTGDMGTEGKGYGRGGNRNTGFYCGESEYSYDGTCKGVSKGSSECEDHIQRG